MQLKITSDVCDRTRYLLQAIWIQNINIWKFLQILYCLVHDKILVSFVIWFLSDSSYYHLRSTVKRGRFFAHVHFSNETVSQTTVSTGPMKMFRLGHEIMNVCQRNVARFDHVEYMFDKVKDIFQGFGTLVSLRLQKDGRSKCKQIWTNLSHWNTDGLSCRCEDLLFFLIFMGTFSSWNVT